MKDLANILERLDNRIARIEVLVSSLDTAPKQEWYSVAEAADILEKAPFTVREWCRHSRINAQKRECGRGTHSEWSISADELSRIKSHGLLPHCK